MCFVDILQLVIKKQKIKKSFLKSSGALRHIALMSVPRVISRFLHIIVCFSVLLILSCFLFFFIPESFTERLRLISANRHFIRGKLCIESHLKDSFSFLWMAYRKPFSKQIPSGNFNLFKFPENFKGVSFLCIGCIYLRIWIIESETHRVRKNYKIIQCWFFFIIPNISVASLHNLVQSLGTNHLGGRAFKNYQDFKNKTRTPSMPYLPFHLSPFCRDNNYFSFFLAFSMLIIIIFK